MYELETRKYTGLEVAVIGLACRFPGAGQVNEFWNNLKNGVESVFFFSDEELEKLGVEPQLRDEANFVKAKCLLAQSDYFDASFFGYTPVEVEILDPQVRIFHECTWEALENAGYDPGRHEGLIGLYAGASSNLSWAAYTLVSGKSVILGEYAASLLNDKDFLCTRISYNLNLRGPSFSIQTACSTSLVAIHLACQGLLSGECDMALAGGVSLNFQQNNGYLYQEGMILSPDGHTRTFDKEAGGTISGEGAGIVVLKPLEDAAADGDYIYAVIRGSAVNNDGSNKIGFTAPGVKGQVGVISAAIQASQVEPETIGFIETHGTGTSLGDPVEIDSLEQAFATDKKNYCAIGSVKTNFGHLGSAAGVASFIKVVLSLHYKTLTPSLNFKTPNPKLDLENSPFYVNTELKEWKNDSSPLRAGVSSFGIGGTNAHAVLEEAPPFIRQQGDESPGKKEILVLSARTQSALDAASANLVEYLDKNKNFLPEDVAYTLQTGRKAFPYRAMTLASSPLEAMEALSSPDSGKLHTSVIKEEDKHVIFMFSGQGSQYVNMGLELYRAEPGFGEEMDKCFEILKPLTDCDLKKILYPGKGKDDPGIDRTEIAQPLLFVFEYALAKLLIKWGIKPYAMIGHSIGEYTAACLSGVFSLEDALKVVVQRGKLMQEMPAGSMLSVSLPGDVVKPLLDRELSLAAANSSSLCVVSGPTEAISRFKKQLEEKGHKCRRLHTSHAFHSSMMEPLEGEFEETLKRACFNQPVIPYISNLTGTWIMEEEAISPAYWCRHLRQPVRFADGIRELAKDSGAIFVEVGPGSSLSTFARQHENRKDHQPVLNLVRPVQENTPDTDHLLTRVGRLWLEGITIDWQSFHGSRKKYRIPLPTYPFERQLFKAEVYSFKPGDAAQPLTAKLQRNPLITDWFYIPTWNRACLSAYKPGKIKGTLHWLIFIDDCGLGERLVDKITGNIVIVVKGDQFRAPAGSRFTLNPRRENDYELLFKELQNQGAFPDRIVHMWGVSGDRPDTPGGEQEVDEMLYPGIYSLLEIARQAGQYNKTKPMRIDIISDNMHEVTGEERINPVKSTLLGPVKIIPQEYANMGCKSIDILLPANGEAGYKTLLEQLLKELEQESTEPIIALRGLYRWVQDFESIRLDKSLKPNPRLKDEGVYLITGGLAGVGLVLAETIAQSVKAPRLVLLGRSDFPPRQEWKNWLFSHYDEDRTSIKIRKILEMEQQGAQVLAISADITDPVRVEKVLAKVREQFRQIDGVIHSAGIPDGGLIQRRTQEMTRQVLAPKVQGTLILERLLADEPLDFFVLCSSYSSILGPLGQVAYCSANAFLDAFAHYKNRRAGTFTVSIDWEVWRETGMAVEAVKRLEGIQSQTDSSAVPSRAVNVNHPMFEKCIFDSPDQSTLISTFSTDKDWFIKEHIIMGKMTLSGTGYLEMARAAFEVLEGKSFPVEIRDVFFFTLLTVEEGEQKQVRTVMTRKDDGYEFLVKSREAPGADQWNVHSVGKITGAQPGPSIKYDLKEFESRCDGEEKIITDEEHRAMPHGPRWNNLKKIRTGKNQQFSTVQLHERYSGDLEHFGLHPAIFDISLTFLDPRFLDYIPFSYQKLKVLAPIPGKVYSYLKIAADNDPSGRTLKYDTNIMDEAGNLLLEIEGLTFARISEIAASTAKQPGKLPGGTAKIQDHQLLRNGLLSSEGAEVFNRILCASVPQVVVSVKNFKQVLAEKKTFKPSLSDEIERMSGRTSTARQRPDISTPYVPPRTDLETKLARIFEAFFGIDKFGINDSFFELGGDSLNAITIANKFHKEFNVELPMAEFYSKPTIKELAKYITEASAARFSGISPTEEKEYYILSSAQKRFYLLQRLKGERLRNNIPIVLMIEGRLDNEKMKATFNKLVQRHESLRTSFHIVEEEPVQVIHRDAALEIEFLEAAEDELDTRIMNFFKPFDLEKAPLMQAAFIRVRKDLHALVADFHHIISDGTMLAIFVREFSASYSGRELPRLKLQYKDYAWWQYRNKESEVMKKQEAYWLNEFKTGAPVLNLPRDFEKTASAHFKIEGIGFDVDLETLGALKKIAIDEGATLYIVLLALFNIFLCKITGQEDFVVGSPIAGRRHSDLENIIGIFVNTLAMRNYPSGEKTFLEFLREVKERTLAAYENQDYQFENLVMKIMGKRDLSQEPLFDVMFSVQNMGIPALEISGLRLSSYSKFKNLTTQFDFELRAYELEDRLVMHFDYRSALYKHETMRQFTGYFREIIKTVLEEKNTRLKDIRVSHRLMEAKTGSFQDYKEDFVF